MALLAIRRHTEASSRQCWWTEIRGTKGSCHWHLTGPQCERKEDDTASTWVESYHFLTRLISVLRTELFRSELVFHVSWQLWTASLFPNSTSAVPHIL